MGTSMINKGYAVYKTTGTHNPAGPMPNKQQRGPVSSAGKTSPPTGRVGGIGSRAYAKKNHKPMGSGY